MSKCIRARSTRLPCSAESSKNLIEQVNSVDVTRLSLAQLSPLRGGRGGRIAAGGQNSGCQLRCLDQLSFPDFVSSIARRQNEPDIGVWLIVPRHQAEGGNAYEGKVRVVGTGLQRAHAPQGVSVRLSSLQQKWFQPPKSAGQRGQVLTARDSIEIDVQGDATLFCVRQACDVPRRARQCPFFSAKKSEAYASPPLLHVWCEGTDHCQRDRNA